MNAIPLDPDEGPTVWAVRDDENHVRVLEGSDPEDPINDYLLSVGEIERLYGVVSGPEEYVVCDAETGEVVRGPFDNRTQAEEAARRRSENIACGHSIKQVR